jgi:hypothetical protein
VPDLALTAVERTPSAFAAEVRRQLDLGARGVAVLPEDGFASEVFGQLPGVAPAAPQRAEVLCLTHGHRPALEEALHFQLDRAGGTVVVGRLERHGLDRPLFLISIPKAGTHLLYRFAERLGFEPGIVCPEFPTPGNWYCIEYSNSHTVPRDFFVDSVRRAPFGNRAHPFLSSAALFIVRHPWDILVSEANYYSNEGNTAFAGVFRDLDFAGCVERLISDHALLGRFRDRILAFQPWLAFENVIPLAFEDLVGEQAGGSRERQERLIWSILLKLGAPGRPRSIAADLFDRASPTFQDGRIGSHRRALPAGLLQQLDSTDADVLRAFGYRSGDQPYSEQAGDWRKRPLRCRGRDFFDTPILVESDYLGHNLIRYSGRLYAIPLALGPVDLARDSQKLLQCPQAGSLVYLRATVLARFLRDQQQDASDQPASTGRSQGDIAQRFEFLQQSLAEGMRRLEALESTVEERTRRLSALEAAIEERTRRLLSLERKR